MTTYNIRKLDSDTLTPRQIDLTENEMSTLFNAFCRQTSGIGYKRTEHEKGIYDKLCKFEIGEQI